RQQQAFAAPQQAVDMTLPERQPPRHYRHRLEQAVGVMQAPVRQRQRLLTPAVDQRLDPGLKVRHGRPQRRRRNASVPLVPPKPKELESASSIFMLRASFGT